MSGKSVSLVHGLDRNAGTTGVMAVNSPLLATYCDTNEKSLELLPKPSVLYVEQCLLEQQPGIFMWHKGNAKVVAENRQQSRVI
jgi:hypothetical protein